MYLSVGIITHNEAHDLPRTLEAIKDIADEIIIVDSGSTDNTLDIARSYHAQIYCEAWKGFGLQKNSVIDKCNGQWILLIDADEEISYLLKEQIHKIVHEENKIKVFKVNFTTYCFGKNVRHGGWGNFYRIRLFQKGAGRYDDKQVHENFITSEPIKSIREQINHYTFRNIEDYFNKFNSYTSKAAVQYFNAGKKKPVFKPFISSFFYFFKTYIIQLGFLDGYEGYLLSKLGALYVFIKYSKLREIIYNQENKHK